MELSSAVIDKRAMQKRREFSWRTVLYGFVRSRRHIHRRDTETDVLFIDWHHPWLFFLAVGTMLMSCLDAFMTVQLIDRGMVELNPLMSAIMAQGTTVFAVSKIMMTGTGILALVYLAKARFLNRLRTGVFLTVFFSIYACLVCYEFVYLLRVL